MTSKAGLDLAFNFGSKKQWQIYIEPSINWAFLGQHEGRTKNDGAGQYGYNAYSNGDQPVYNIHNSMVQLNAGIVYKFKNSNGAHNFTIVTPRDQAEIDGLNAQINGLRNDLNVKDAELNGKDARIADLQKALEDANNRPTAVIKQVKEVKETTVTNLQPTVLFRQGKSVVDPSQMPKVERVATYLANHKEATVVIKGYASPEGSLQFNEKLAAARANAVKTILVKRYRIAASRITAEGQGIGNMFSEPDWNRVSICTLDQK